MIRADSQPVKYQAEFSNGVHVSLSDTTSDNGGSNLGFRPHELLEAALASCMSMSVRMCAERCAIPLANVTVTVFLDRSDSENPLFEYSVQLHGEITASQKDQLLIALERCPVRSTLSKPLRFKYCGE